MKKQAAQLAGQSGLEFLEINVSFLLSIFIAMIMCKKLGKFYNSDLVYQVNFTNNNPRNNAKVQLKRLLEILEGNFIKKFCQAWLANHYSYNDSSKVLETFYAG